MAKINFWKMQALGNDYIVLKDWRQRLGDYSALSKVLCKRRVSVGADGMIVLCKPSKIQADVKMRIFNADGSEAEMCGNGIRCLAKYAYENSIVNKRDIDVETLAGLRKVRLKVNRGFVESVSVDMGEPVFNRKAIPMEGEGEFIGQTLTVNGKLIQASCLSIGNPHCVVFVEDVEKAPVEELGPAIETHPYFPKRVNVEFVKVMDRKALSVRVWERGCGETMACGTGACAAATVAHRLGKVEDEVVVRLRGGDLKVKLNGRIRLEGPVVKVYEGKISSEVRLR
ncbi:MAG: diaminopimelate epimerase [Candidatus Bathyarchaeia archaeon]